MRSIMHDYLWADLLTADPKTRVTIVVLLLLQTFTWIPRLPVYEASHEFDKRGRRNNLPLPQHAHAPPEHVRPALQH